MFTFLCQHASPQGKYIYRVAKPNVSADTGLRIRQMREARGWTQQELAQKAGVSRPAVTQWESGKTKDPKRGSLLGIAHAFGVTVEDLISDAPVHIAEERATYKAKGGGAITREEEVLLEKYRNLAPDDRARLQEIVSALDATRAKRPAKKAGR